MTVYARPGWRQTYAWVTDEESERLDEVANYWGTSRAAIVRRALTMYLDSWRAANIMESLEEELNDAMDRLIAPAICDQPRIPAIEEGETHNPISRRESARGADPALRAHS